MENNFIKISRDCDGVLIPSGDSIKILKDSPVKITQSLGGYFTLYVNGNLVKLDGKDADAIGQKIEHNNKVNQKQEFDENLIWEQLKTCYDPEIPVNVVDLGLIYDLSYEQSKNEKFYVKIKMTLTAPGCGMGPTIAADVEHKVQSLHFVDDVLVELVWDPLWNKEMMTEEAKLKLGMM
ncbi:MAG: putative Fe-S cluster assembly protein SufT [Candidatus Marinimicrobia bacterium]|nr:putative Fe-S cluster assembly protein SufT [Candidatus Neomarinimicrobiota bacterium]|tara:strand:+ start:5743 stop:6279 length:537 start_codon:yes stop_codon:yes gene_type:complete